MAFTITQGDTVPPLSSTLTDSGEPVDITGYQEVSFHMEDMYERIVVDDNDTGRVNVIDESTGEVEYVWSSSDTSDIGTYEAEWEVTHSDGSTETFPGNSKIIIEVTEEIA